MASLQGEPYLSGEDLTDYRRMEAPVPLDLKQLPAISQQHATELRNRGFCVVKGLLGEAVLAETVRLPASLLHRVHLVR